MRAKLIDFGLELIFSEPKLIDREAALQDVKPEPIHCKPEPYWFTSEVVTAREKHIDYTL